MNSRTNALGILALLAFCSSAYSQSFNLDVGANQSHPLPQASYGAGANQSGAWFGVSTTAQVAVTLSDLAGTPTTVTLQPAGGTGDFAVNNPTINGDDDSLMEDASDCGPVPGTNGMIVWTLSGLAPGNYAIYTYAWAPDFPAIYHTEVSVTGANEGLQLVGGAWSGSPHVLGVTYAKHTLSVAAGNNVTITTATQVIAGLTNYGTVNGFQVVRENAASPFCFGDGTQNTPCPCGNSGLALHGCDNSIGSGGAILSIAGTTNPDAAVLSSSGELGSSLSIFLQGDTNLTGVVFGDGVRCAGGVLKRLYVKSASSGVATAPVGSDNSITAQSAALGDPIAPGSARYYQTYYRDPNPGFCPAPTGNSWNVSSGLRIDW